MSQKVVLENKSLDNIDIASQLSSFQSKIINIIYPVGAIYISTASTSPQTLFGGSWESIGTGRCLMGVDSSHAAGTTAEAGLPNIRGSITGANWNQDYGIYGFQTEGSFYKVSTKPSGRIVCEDTYWGSGSDSSGWFGVDASMSSSVYGKSSTVQPPAYYVYMWRRRG